MWIYLICSNTKIKTTQFVHGDDEMAMESIEVVLNISHTDSSPTVDDVSLDD